MKKKNMSCYVTLVIVTLVATSTVAGLNKTTIKDETFEKLSREIWYNTTVDSVGSVGYYTSLALDSNNHPHISYATYYGALKYATWTGSSWLIQTIDDALYVYGIWHPSIALDSFERPHIVYSDIKMGELKYAYWDGSSWTIEIVDSSTSGFRPSLALDSNDYPHISYSGIDSDLKYAHWTGSMWSTVTLDSYSVGASSLKLDSNDYPHICYYEHYYDNLKYASWTGSSWSFEIADPSVSAEDQSISLALDSNGYPHISYSDYWNNDLRYAHRTGSTWTIQTIETTTNRHNSIAVDSSNNPHICYGSANYLKYASWTGSTWSIGNVDSPGGNAGLYCSLALGSDNRPRVSYLDNRNYDLKYATAEQNNLPWTPRTPNPSNGAMGVGVDITLQWLGGDPDPTDYVKYDVYFGTTSPPPYYATISYMPANAMAISYHLPTLNYNQRYYWKIVSTDHKGGISPGPIWTFKPTPDSEWYRTYGTYGNDYAYSLDLTTDGGFILAGFTNYQDGSNTDLYLIKTDQYGNVQWDRIHHRTYSQYIFSVEQTVDGGYIMTGFTTGGMSDLPWLVKTDSQGFIEWDYTYGGGYTMNGLSRCVHQTTDQGYIVVGRSYVYTSDIWLLKTDRNGTELWNRTYNKPYSNDGFSVQQTMDGGYIIIGETNDGTGSKAWLIKTDAQGIMQWNTTYQKYFYTEGRDVQQTSDGGYIFCANSGTATWGSYDIWLVKTDANGNIQWDNLYGGSLSDGVTSLDQTLNGGYILSGATGSFGVGSNDAYVICVNATGSLLWQNTYGLSKIEAGFSIQQLPNEDYILAGYTNSTDHGDYDVLLIKIQNENQPPNEPSNPSPPNGSIYPSLDCILSWTGGDQDYNDIATYDVYFGTTNPPLKKTSNQSQTTYDPGVLNYDTTYYWRIVSWDNHGASTPGPLWTFTIPPYQSPVANDDNYFVDYGCTLSVPVPGVLGNDLHQGYNPLTAAVDTLPSHASSFTFFSDGSFSYVHDQSISTTDTFTYHANDSQSDSNIATVTITINLVNMSPFANFTYLPDNPTSEDIVSFADTSVDIDGFIVHWWWDFGDDYYSSKKNPVHCYADDGSYNVTLTVTDNDGRQGSIQKTLVVYTPVNHAPDVPDVPTGPMNGIRNVTQMFFTVTHDSDLDPVSYQFDWGDATMSGWIGPCASGVITGATHSWTTADVFQIRVRARDIHGLVSLWSNLVSLRVYLLGDVNGDNAADNFDIGAFNYAITHTPCEYYATYPTGYYYTADCNLDGSVDNFDIAAFVAILSGG